MCWQQILADQIAPSLRMNSGTHVVLEIVLQEVQARDAAQYNARAQRQDKGVEVEIIVQHVANNDVR
jgi:hypothetical protein